MLFDEPFANLDVMLEAELVELVHRILSERRMTALFVTHDPREAERLAHRVVVLEAGRITARGSLDEVLASPGSPFIRALSTSGSSKSCDLANLGILIRSYHDIYFVSVPLEVGA